MKTFTDNAGRTWTVAMTLDAAKRVKDLLGVNLLDIEGGEPPLISRLGTDEILLCDVIFALIQPQAEAQGVSDREWAAALGGEAILAAQEAFYEELIAFFLLRGRGDRAKALTEQKRMIVLVIEANEARLDAVDVEAEVRAIFGKPSTSSPGSSASPPAP